MKKYRSMSAGNKRSLSLSLVVAAVLSLVPISSHAAVFWDDEMEAGNTGYPGLVSNGYSCGGVPGFTYDTVNKVSGSASLKENFPGLQYHQQCGGFADRSFPSTSDLWGRFYVRLSPSFVVSTVTTKIMRNDTNTDQDHWWGMAFGSNQVMLALQNYPTIGSSRNFYTNVGDGALPRGQFVCIETRIKLNTVGQADGLVEAYKNGVRFLYYTGLEIRKVSQGTQGAQFYQNRMYRQDGAGSINYDRVAMGNTRIGCLGSVPASDSTPPAPPVGVVVR
jgi:hypothetical protein